MKCQTAITDFLTHCQYEKNLSQKTVKAYSIDLMQLIKFLSDKNHSMSISDVSKIELRGFLESISALKPKSIKRKIAAIKTLFNFLEFEDLLIQNPIRKMKIKIKEPKTIPRVMDINEVNNIFKFVYSENAKVKNNKSYAYSETLRNIVVIELLFSTGARVSEIANLVSEDIDTNTGSITIKGKGNKERIIQICNEETLAVLRKYYNVCSDRINNSGGFFLTNRFGNKLSDQSIRTIVKFLSGKSGIKKHITPHSFRHSVATLLLENDVDIKYIQSVLGHSSIMTTQIYTHVNREKQRQILRLKHPRKDFSMQ